MKCNARPRAWLLQLCINGAVRSDGKPSRQDGDSQDGKCRTIGVVEEAIGSFVAFGRHEEDRYISSGRMIKYLTRVCVAEGAIEFLEAFGRHEQDRDISNGRAIKYFTRVPESLE